MNKRTEIVVERRTVTVVRRRGGSIGQPCGVCGLADVMFPAHDAATFLGVTSGEVFRAAERGAVHFEEHIDGVLWICLVSLLRLHSPRPEESSP